MKESRDGNSKAKMSKSASASSLPLILDVEDFKVSTWTYVITHLLLSSSDNYFFVACSYSVE